MFAVLSSRPDFLTNISYQTAGIFVVMGSLTFLMVVVAIMGRLLNPKPRPAPSVVVSPTAASVPDDDLPPELRAAIVAAAVASLEGAHRVVEIRPVDIRLQAWSLEGRRHIFQSHTLR
jgi:Oxaloacetate decarboxylase, gamma chain.